MSLSSHFSRKYGRTSSNPQSDAPADKGLSRIMANASRVSTAPRRPAAGGDIPFASASEGEKFGELMEGNVIDGELWEELTVGEMADQDLEPVDVIVVLNSKLALDALWNRIGTLIEQDVSDGDYITGLSVGSFIEALQVDDEVKSAFEEALTEASVMEQDIQSDQRAASHIDKVKDRQIPVTDKIDFVEALSVQVPAADLRAIGTMFANNPDLKEKLPIVTIEKNIEYVEDIAESAVQVGVNPGLWNQGYDGTGVKVAVIDSGVDITHEDLAGSMSDPDADFADFTGAGKLDDSGHGTHVAGTVLGRGMASGGRFTGIAYKANLMAAKVLHARKGNTAQILKGLGWSVGRGADVINMSLGASVPTHGRDVLSKAVNKAVQDYGVVVCVAAGNSGRVIDQNRRIVPGLRAKMTIGSPGAAEHALTVGAVDNADKVADFSSIGPVTLSSDPSDIKNVKPDVVGPGVDIVAALASGIDYKPPRYGRKVGLAENFQNKYTFLSGTSMATPVVSGVCALMVQAYKKSMRISTNEQWQNAKRSQRDGVGNNAAAQIKQAVMKTALTLARDEQYEVRPDKSAVFGMGRVQAEPALRLITGEIPVPVTRPATGMSPDLMEVIYRLKQDNLGSLPHWRRSALARLRRFIVRVVIQLAELRTGRVSGDAATEERYAVLLDDLLSKYDSLRSAK